VFLKKEKAKYNGEGRRDPVYGEPQGTARVFVTLNTHGTSTTLELEGALRRRQNGTRGEQKIFPGWNCTITQWGPNRRRSGIFNDCTEKATIKRTASKKYSSTGKEVLL